MAAVAASDPPNSSLEATLRESIARLAEAEKMGLQENKNSSIIEAVDQDYIQVTPTRAYYKFSFIPTICH